jgi:hypothetical protein
MRRAAPIPSELGEAFAVAAAFDAGLSRDRLRARDLARPFRGGRATRKPQSVLDRVSALAPLLNDDQHYSHLTAAELQGMRFPERHVPQRLHVTYRDANRAMRRPSVVGHKTTAAVAVAELPDGVRVSSPVDAWCECATLLTVDELVVMGDGLVSRRAPAARLDQLIHAVNMRPGRRGTARLRQALPLIRSGTDSARETLLRLAVVRAGFPEPEVNAPLVDRHGTVIAHGDLAWPQYRVVLEYEGRQHAEDTAQFAIDIRRLDDIAESDYRVIRVDRQLFAATADLTRRIATALRDRGWHPAAAEGSLAGQIPRGKAPQTTLRRKQAKEREPG